VTRFQYDDLNRLRFTTLNYVSGGPTNFETNVSSEVRYDRLGRTAERIDGRGNPTTYGYDDLGRTRFVTDANSNTIETVYDGLGNRRFVINGEGEQTEFQYDGVNRLVAVLDALGNTTSYEYNKAGERTAMIDAETIRTSYQYDDLSRLITVTENEVTGNNPGPDQDVITRYGYDAVGNRTVITNALGFSTSYVYDTLNRRTRLTDALGNATTYGYDAVGNRTVITDANGVVTTFSYDNVYRLTSINYSDATPDVTFTYDNVGNRETMSDGTGQISYGYDELYRLDSVTDGAGLQVGYRSDEVGNRTRLTYPLAHGGVVTYTYDAANRLDTVTDWNNGQFGYNYDDANRLTDLSLPNGLSSSYAYDDAGRLTLLSHNIGTDTLSGYDYALDNVGNRRTLTETLVTVQDIATGTFLEAGGQVVMEGENGVRANGLSHTWNLLTSQPGYTGTSYLQTSLDIDVLYQTNEITASPRVDYRVNFTTAGTYTLWLRGYPTNAAGDSAYVGLDGALTEVTGFAPNQWRWANVSLSNSPVTLPISTTGLYTVSLWMREDGLRIDRLLLTTDTTFIPTGFGPAESTRQAVNGSLTAPLERTIVYTYDNLYRLTDADYSTERFLLFNWDRVW
jgi:YD repeat-containing protein